MQDLNRFDHGAPAGLFPSPNRNGRTRRHYRLFDTAREAVRFGIEELPKAPLLGAYLEADEARLAPGNPLFLQ
jgi:transposase